MSRWAGGRVWGGGAAVMFCLKLVVMGSCTNLAFKATHWKIEEGAKKPGRSLQAPPAGFPALSTSLSAVWNTDPAPGQPSWLHSGDALSASSKHHHARNTNIANQNSKAQI